MGPPTLCVRETYLCACFGTTAVRIRHGTMIVEFPECAKKLWLAELPGVEDSEGEMRVLLQGEC